MKPLLIGVTGYARYGKDTVGRILTEHHGYRRIGFADNVRKTALALDPIIESSTGARLSEIVALHGWEYAKELHEVRRTLQRMGTEVGRNHFGRDVWINMALKGVKEYTVVTDVRFPNEAEAIKERGGVIWRVLRSVSSGVSTWHASEAHIMSLPVDHMLFNNGTIEDLGAAVALVLQPSVEHDQYAEYDTAFDLMED